MKKESLISFRAGRDLHESLTRVAREDQRTLSSTIEIALTSYLKERKAFHGNKKEKRQYPRETLSIPAIINKCGVSDLFTWAIRPLGFFIPQIH